MNPLSRKLFWLAFWVIGFAVFMTGLLLYFKYQSVFTGLQRDRVMMVANEIDDIAEKNLSLGQDFWEIATLQDVIERRREADKIFLGIEVVGRDGKIAYSTDLARVGSSLPPAWLSEFALVRPNNRLSPSPDEAILASAIRNSFNQVAGYAVIRYGRQLEHEAMAQFTRRLTVTCGGVFLVFTLLLWGVLACIRNRTENILKRAAHTISGDAHRDPAMAGEVAAIEAQLTAAHRQLDAVNAGQAA
ncbi:MAG: hypothetical protein ABL931_04200 [Usitatibacteraceae bacterium]